MICEECVKCWLNYIGDCEGLDNFIKDKCKKIQMKTEVIEESSDNKPEEAEENGIKRKCS